MAGPVVQRRYRWTLLAIILLAFALRIYLLGATELWFDEALSAVIAGKAWAEIVAHTQSAPFEHPPTFYLALRAWTLAAGNGEFALRFFSLFWGVLLIPLLYRFMAPWGGSRFALLTALVASLSVTLVEYSRDVRMYALIPVLGILVLHFFFRAVESGRARWWFLFLVVAVLGISIHVYFSLVLLVLLAFLLLAGRATRRVLLGYLGILVAAAVPVGIWLWLSPGPRQAVLLTLSGSGPSTSSLAQRLRFTVEALFLPKPAAGHMLLGLLAVLGAVVCPLPPPRRGHAVRLVGSRAFLLVWLLVPWLAALIIPYWLQGRHLAYLWPALCGLVACGLLSLRRWGRVPFGAGLLLLFVVSGLGLVERVSPVEDAFQFGRIMAHIEDRALSDDLVIMNQPALWPLAEYYSRRDLDRAYVPDPRAPKGSGKVADQLSSLVQGRSRVWLGPVGAWTADPKSRVESWLVGHLYPAHKEWFPGSGSATLFFVGGALDPLPVERGVAWEGGLRLLEAGSSPAPGAAELAPGDALLLSLTWQASEPVDASHLVSVALVGEDGEVWVERQSAPCGGMCPTAGPAPGWRYTDHHALQVPAGTPPGAYRLQVGWYSPGEGRTVPLEAGGERLDLGEVRVVRSEAVAGEMPNAMKADLGDQVSLTGFDLSTTQVPAGGTAELELHWLARAQPLDDFLLRLELVDPGGEVAAWWERPPVAAFLPTSAWREGDTLRARQRLTLPGQLAAGNYRLQLKLLDSEGQPLALSGWRSRDGLGWLMGPRLYLEGETLELGELAVTERPERPRTFEVPGMQHSLRIKMDQGVELLGYDLSTRAAVPGGNMALTLYWRAGGATDRPYKVFAHLGDGSGPPLAQDDGHPGDGCCPTDTWVEGEIVVDRHVIPLDGGLPPGSYALTVGMYDEESGLRLAAYDEGGAELDGGQALVAEVVVRQPSTPEPTVAPRARPEMPYRGYLPFVIVGW